MAEFTADLIALSKVMYDAATKSFAWKRLQLLEARPAASLPPLIKVFKRASSATRNSAPL